MAKKHSVHEPVPAAVESVAAPSTVAETPTAVVESSGKRWRATNGNGESWEGQAETIEDVVRAFNGTLTGGRTFPRKALTIIEL